MENNKNTDVVYDAKTLGTTRMFVLGLQHMFAMFGATVLVPAITGLNVSTTLLFAGLGTLLFHLITGRKVPAFLGSSFAFLGAYGLVMASGKEIPLREVELELKEGPDAALLAFGPDFAKRFALEEEPLSKFARAKAL